MNIIVTHVLESMNEVVTNNYKQSHQAIDIVPSNNIETDIIALDSGTVETVVNNTKGPNHQSKGLATYGNYVEIKQNNGKTALYAHMKYNSIKVNKGDQIQKGDTIGTIGDTGNAYGKHLHLEIKNENGVRENPINTLNTTSQDTYKQTIQENNQSIKKTASTAFLKAPNYHYGSIVDALKSIGSNSSYNYRKKLAENNGIQNYHGTYYQNIKMLKLLKNGQLKKA